jgi:hypothetical protein
MPVTIPESVFTKYYDVIDSTFTIFGVTCQLVYIEKVEEISNTYDNIPSNRSVNSHRRNGPSQYRRQNKVIREVEKIEDINLKVYWDSKNWVKVGGDIKVPDNSIQTIFLATDLDKIKRAKEIIVHKDIKASQEMRFKRSGEPFPMGLRKNRYFGCFWERS